MQQDIAAEKKDKLRRQLWAAGAATLLMWSFCAYSLLFEWIGKDELLARRIAGKPFISDFVNTYDAGLLARQGRSVKIFDPEVQAELQKKVVAPVVPELPFYCQLPPNFFVASLPLSFFSPIGAWLVYCGFGFALILFSFGALAWKYFDDKFARAFVVLSAAAAFPTWVGIEEGNASIYLLPTLLLFWWLLQRKKYFFAGLATGLLMVKVQYLPIIGIAGLFIGGLPYLGGALIAAAVTVAGSIAVLGADNVMAWPQVLLHAETTSSYIGVAADKMQNILGMLTAVTGHVATPAGRSISNALFVAAILLVAYLWRTPFRKLSERSVYAFEVCAALTTGVMLIFSIHTHSHDYIVLLLSCLWFYVAGKRDDAAPLKMRNRIAAASLSFAGVSWPLFLLAQLPFLPFQPIATFALIYIACAAWIWFRPMKAAAEAPVGVDPS